MPATVVRGVSSTRLSFIAHARCDPVIGRSGDGVEAVLQLDAQRSRPRQSLAWRGTVDGLADDDRRCAKTAAE